MHIRDVLFTVILDLKVLILFGEVIKVYFILLQGELRPLIYIYCEI